LHIVQGTRVGPTLYPYRLGLSQVSLLQARSFTLLQPPMKWDSQKSLWIDVSKRLIQLFYSLFRTFLFQRYFWVLTVIANHSCQYYSLI